MKMRTMLCVGRRKGYDPNPFIGKCHLDAMGWALEVKGAIENVFLEAGAELLTARDAGEISDDTFHCLIKTWELRPNEVAMYVERRAEDWMFPG